MKFSGFEISRRHYHPGWLVTGAVIGRAAGLMLGLNLGFWYLADPVNLIAWQITGAIITAILCSMVMTSDTTVQTKGALLGLGIGFAVAVYSGEIWINMQAGRDADGFRAFEYAEGIFFEWYYQHMSFLGLIIGWITGVVISRRRHPGGSVPEKSDILQAGENG